MGRPNKGTGTAGVKKHNNVNNNSNASEEQKNKDSK